MYALPPDVSPGKPQVTGLPCPECSGVLEVRAEGRHTLLFFECRVGHTYDVVELLVAKEDMLEQKLWAAATALSELTALMSDLEGRAGSAAEAATYRGRAAQARVQAAGVTTIIEANQPIDLSTIVPGGRSGAVGAAADHDGETGTR